MCVYLIPRPYWVSFLEACRMRLRLGGRVIIKEVATVPRWKFFRCLAQETITVRLVRLTPGRELTFASRQEMLRVLHRAHFHDVRMTDHSAGYMMRHVLYQ